MNSSFAILSGLTVVFLPLLQANAANITLGPGTTAVSSSNQFIGMGDYNTFAGPFPQLAIGYFNSFEAITIGTSTFASYGLLIGDSNSLRAPSDGSILAGYGNDVIGAYSGVFGVSNFVGAESSSQSIYGNIVTGESNQVVGYYLSAVFGEGNIVEHDAAGSIGTSSFVAGRSNELSSDTGWIIGYDNEVSGWYSAVLGVGLMNPGFNSVVVGAYNEQMAGSSVSHEETGAAFVVGNGNALNSRSNAIETLKNGETTLINKTWNPSSPLGVPTAPTAAAGRALVVEGHTVLKGQVIIAEPQGDISMGDYTN